MTTLFLRKVNFKSLKELYLEGHFKDFKPPEAKIDKKKGIKASTVFSDTELGRIYRYKNQHSRYVTVAYANHNNFSELISERKKKPKLCMWCRRKTESLIGVPIREETRYILKENNSDKINIEFFDGVKSYNYTDPDNLTNENLKKISILHTIGNFCTYNCALAFSTEKSFTGDSIYNSSSSILYSIFSKKYPGKKLKPAKDWMLFDINGGSLTQEEYYDEKFDYKYIGGVINIPVKITFNKMSVNLKV